MKKVELKNFMIGTWNVGLLYRVGYLRTVISIEYCSDFKNKMAINGNLQINKWIFHFGQIRNQIDYVVVDKIIKI